MTVQPRFEGPNERNVLGEPLQPCSSDPLTGFFRTGFCAAGSDGVARHLVCIVATRAFLEFSRTVGNDLSTPRPEMAFPGLADGDRWCLHVERFVQALAHDAAPRVVLRATHAAVLERVPLEALTVRAADLN